jgi:transposase
MHYVAGCDRDQQVLFPEVLDDYVGEDNPVRFIDAFVDSLELEALGFRHARLGEMGRPPYDPGDLLRLYVYGYLHRIRSSRKLEQETHRNVELMWLLRRLRPDFKTIADFRRDNAKAIRRVCGEFTVLCKRLDLFAGELVAIDGSKFRAANSKQRNFSGTDLRRLVRRIDRRIGDYLGALDKEDEAETGMPGHGCPDLRQRIEALRSQRDEYQGLLERLEESGEQQVSLTDPDSRRMKSGMRTEVSYNVQAAVEAKHKLIVAHEVTNGVNDLHALGSMASKAQAELGVEGLTVVADRGYYNASEIKACVDVGVTPLVAKPQISGSWQRGLFTKDDFTYDESRDCYRCPAGEVLSYRSTAEKRGRWYHHYRTAACGGCEIKAQCTRSRHGRKIERWEHEAVLEEMARRLAARPKIMNQRAMLAEHPFGTAKRWMDQGYFLLRGLEKVATEWSMTVLAYNLKRVIRIVGVPRMIAALG